MQPFVAAEHVKQAYRRYIQTSFPIRRDAVRRRFEVLIEHERLLWQDPFVSLSRPFARGANFDELIAEGVLGEEIGRGHWGFSSLFHHQVVAARRLAAQKGARRNTIVATGTGSGKTEAFILPIVDDCLRDPSPGVRAVILYPMNALANDQLNRLRRQLAGTGVTFGRYTGDTPFDPESAQTGKVWRPKPDDAPEEERYYRREFQENPPHILLTNHAMLELLLVRNHEQRIFRGVRPRFLVLDEVHTYTGVLGAEVACLLRRFKEHVGVSLGALACVGTSATVKSMDGRRVAVDRKRLLEFATNLFGEEFEEDAIVEEQYEPLRSTSAMTFASAPSIRSTDVEGFDPSSSEAVLRLYRVLAGHALQIGTGESMLTALHRAIEPRREFSELEHLFSTPRSLTAAVEAVRLWPGREHADDAQLRAELSALFLLGCAAERPDSGGDVEPRFRPKVHLQIRSLSPLHGCVTCGALLTDGKAECDADDHEGVRRALVLGVCRSCGQDVLIGRFKSRGAGTPKIAQLGQVELEPDDLDEDDATLLYLAPLGTLSNLNLNDEPSKRKWMPYAVCSRCLVAVPVGPEMADACEVPDCGGERVRFEAFLKGSSCPVCRAQGRGRRPEIITPLRSGAAASVSVLTQSLFPELHRDTTTGEDEKKVLIFADSRQDTAHQAGYLRDRHQTFTQRQIVWRVLREMRESGLPFVPFCDEQRHPVLAREVFLRTRTQLGEAETFNLLTPVAARSGDDAGFYEPDRIISDNERTRAIERLRWDLTVEFTDRATGRYSLEREGLATARYVGLDEVGAEIAGGVPGCTAAQVTAVVRAVLDYLRYSRMVNYGPFRDYLGAGSDDVRRGIARPTPQTRTPFGMDGDRRQYTGAYAVKSWYAQQSPLAHATATVDIVHRALPHLDGPAVAGFIDRMVQILERRGLLRRVDIGRLTSGFGRRTTSVLQLSERVIEVGFSDESYRCDACQRTLSYQLVSAATGEPICTGYRCKGVVRRHVPDAENNFYVRFYTREAPERLFAMEHSGQLSGVERVRIEERFRTGLVNALVCTPTLELGVNIGDLVAIVLRNIPPTPSNYAQRAGRAGREHRIALILSHAGLGPHDSYFFEHPEEMIAGAIRPPTFLLDNRVVINRHLNSLILEKLDVGIPSEWSELHTEDGQLRLERLQPIEDELRRRRSTIQTSVAHAFVRERAGGGLAWLDENYVRERIDAFMDGLRGGLDHWCARYREIYEELLRSRRRVVPTAAEQERERRLRMAIEILERDQRYYPLSYLAQVGFLPRYGFPGDSVVVRDAQERQIAQAAAVGIVEFAPGNSVYVAGRKLRVERILFRGGTREDPRQNAETYRYCATCSFVTTRATDQECEHCHQTLTTGRFLKYEAARGTEVASIGQEDEYRDRSSYDLATYLVPQADDAPPVEERDYNGWRVRYSRLREVEIYNRGRGERDGTTVPFMVCLECGMCRESAPASDDDGGSTVRGSGHLHSCSVGTWDTAATDRIEPALHLRAAFRGDVLQVALGEALPEKQAVAWRATFDQALRLGLQLEMYIGAKEVGSFVREWVDGSATRHELVLYDTMPGGTGYLRRLADELPRIAGRVVEHLVACSCRTACYRCLKEFWNQRYHRVLDKELVLTALRTIAASVAAPIGTTLSPSAVRTATS